MRLELYNIKQNINSEFGINIRNLIIDKGETVAITGKTGSGKTSFLNLISGLTYPDEGQIYYGGVSIYEKEGISILRDEVGYVFQFPEKNLFEKTVKKELQVSLKNEKLDKKEFDCRCNKILSIIGLDSSVLNKNPLSLSGGEKRKIAIATILIKEPEVLLLDEPIAGLDPNARESFLDMLNSFAKKGMTVIMVTHSSEAASRMNRLIAFENGKIKYDGEAKKILSDRYLCYDVGLAPPCSTQISEVLFVKGLNIKPTSDRMELIEQIVNLIGEKND